MSRPTKQAALTRDLGLVLSSLDEAAVELIPSLITRMRDAINDPDTKLETQYQIFKFFVAHAEKAHEDRIKTNEQEIKKVQEATEDQETTNMEFFSLDMSEEDKANYDKEGKH